jgi:uncharacterized lipoprotein YmbA
MKSLLLLPAMMLILTGCNLLQPVKDLSVNHILDPLVADRTLTAATPAIAVNRPSLPSYLDRQQLVTRAGGELVLSDRHLWAEPLDAAIARVTASNLSRLTGSLNIQTVAAFSAPDYTNLLEIQVAQFEPDAANHLILQGTWKLQPVIGRETRTRFFHIEVPVPVTPDVMTGRVSAMNRALELLARQIAGKI